MDLTHFLKHPAITLIRYAQLFIALGIYCFFALSQLNTINFITSDSTLHFLGNIFLFASVWLATCFLLKIQWQLIITIPFALAIEAAQAFSATRHVDLADMAVNLAGLAVGAILCIIIRYLFLNRSR